MAEAPETVDIFSARPGISLSMAGTAVQKPYVMRALWGYTGASNIGHRMSDH
jgi:hypothetical protein